MNKATSIGAQAFYNCSNLKMLYIPKVKGLADDNYKGCTNLNIIFAPEIKYLTLSIPSNATIYCGDELLTGLYLDPEYAGYKYTIISPEYQPWINNIPKKYQSSVTHIISDDIAQSKGAQIRTKDNGLRFGFAFAENIEYGFVYTYESLDGLNDFQINDSLRVDNSAENHKRTADKRTVEGTVSTYNAVFTCIPKDHLTDKISARAYVCIDGMYFYSPVTTRSFAQVANAVVADDAVDENVKNTVSKLLNQEG